MKKILALSVIAVFLYNLPSYSQGGGGVKNGELAPQFTAKDQDGKTVSLSQYKGKKLVLYFYPKDDTPGCTQEACNLRDNYDSLTRAGYSILGVSGGDELSHKNFQTKYKLPFPLIADKDNAVRDMYGAWVEENGEKTTRPARRTYIIDENGRVVHRIDDVNTKQHAAQLLSLKKDG